MLECSISIMRVFDAQVAKDFENISVSFLVLLGLDLGHRVIEIFDEDLLHLLGRRRLVIRRRLGVLVGDLCCRLTSAVRDMTATRTAALLRFVQVVNEQLLHLASASVRCASAGGECASGRDSAKDRGRLGEHHGECC